MPLPSKCDFAKEVESILSEFESFAQLGVFVRPELGLKQIPIVVPDMEEISVFIGKDDFVLGSVFCAERKNASRGQLVEHNACWRNWLNSDASQTLRDNRTILTGDFDCGAQSSSPTGYNRLAKLNGWFDCYDHPIGRHPDQWTCCVAGKAGTSPPSTGSTEWPGKCSRPDHFFRSAKLEGCVKKIYVADYKTIDSGASDHEALIGDFDIVLG